MIIDVNKNYFEKYCSAETLAKIIDYPSIGHMWQDCATKYAELEAIEDQGQKYTYATLDEDMGKFRSLLMDADLNKGDNIGIIVQSSYDFVKTYMAAQTLGLVTVLIPIHLEGQDLSACVKRYHMKALI